MAKLKSINKLDTWTPDFTDVKEYFDTNMDPNTMDLDDQDVYANVYGEGKWAGIFQCIAEGTYIETPSGKRLIEDINVDDWIVSYDEDAKAWYHDIVQEIRVDERPCIELLFDDGSTLICTPDHWIKTVNHGWIEASNLTDDDEIMQGELNGVDLDVHVCASSI